MSTTQGPAKAAPAKDHHVREAIVTLASLRPNNPGNKLRIVAALFDLLQYGDNDKTMEFMHQFMDPESDTRSIQEDMLLFAEVMDALMGAAEELGLNPYEEEE